MCVCVCVCVCVRERVRSRRDGNDSKRELIIERENDERERVGRNRSCRDNLDCNNSVGNNNSSRSSGNSYTMNHHGSHDVNFTVRQPYHHCLPSLSLINAMLSIVVSLAAVLKTTITTYSYYSLIYLFFDQQYSRHGPILGGEETREL